MPDTTPNVTPNPTPDMTPSTTPKPGTTPEKHRPTDDRPDRTDRMRAATPLEKDRTTATRTAPTSGTPTSGTTAPGAPLLPDDEYDRLASRMRDAVVGFVDGPRDAVAEADQVLEELAARFTDAMDRRRRTLRGSWQQQQQQQQPTAAGGKDRSSASSATSSTSAEAVDTEQLRLALRDYRELTERLLHI
ncbi:hypothetical protein OG352_12610 [Streptomyces sp. NBC_01485]|uniref:hypothetical protein n=1 Tax=Streptomyces sp. NBC_01485 TaxID=2903884 RepID=UPI002E32B7AB|nr:hypothetical protein [Streptomyces sp. NBC_01485]